MTNLDSYEQKWFIEGQGLEQNLIIDGANKKATVAYNKPATVPNTFAGIWYSPRKLFNLSGAKYLSLKVSASVPTTLTFDLFDVNNKRYGLLPNKRISTSAQLITFVFDQKPADEGFDFSKIAAVLINTSTLIDYKGTITISELKIGDKAEGAPAAKPAEIVLDELTNRTIFKNIPAFSVPLFNLKVLKDGINQGSPITLSIASSNTALIPVPTAPTVYNDQASIKFTPVANQTGKAIITITASSPGLPNKVSTLEINVVEKSTTTATTIAIDQSQVLQRISGIGTRAEDMDMAIGDLGASMLRFDMGAEFEDLEVRENDNSDPFILDITKFNYTSRYDFKRAYELGCKRIIGCVWTPPVWMKGILSERPQFPIAPNVVLPEYYDEFAEYILGACIAFKNHYGFEMYSVCLQNEAEFYSSENLTATAGYTPETMAEVVRRVYPRLRAAGLTTTIHGFDALPAQGNVITWFKYFNDNTVVEPTTGKTVGEMVDAYSFHSYSFNAQDVGTLRNDEVVAMVNETRRKNPTKELWMTETSGEPSGLEGGLWQISTQFVVYSNGLNAWVNLGVRPQDGMKYYAYKNFSKFIRPNAVRLGTTNSNGISSLAFKNDEEKTYTIVLSNLGTTDQQVKLSGTAGLPSKMYAYLTALNINCELVDTVTSTDAYMVNLPANSVLTLSSKYEDVTATEDEAALANMEMVVYPNPTSGEMNIMLPTSNFKEISVIDITGRLMMTKAIKSNGSGSEYLDLSSLQKGVYIISAKGESTLRKKIVVE
jgi:O-glycosyl hydrolase